MIEERKSLKRGQQTSAECFSDCFLFLNAIQFQTADAYPTLDLTNVKYNMNVYKWDEKLKARCDLHGDPVS
jgi:hypothetical protein